MNKIVINGSIDKELATTLAKLCIQIQTEFDISSDLLNTMINNPEFIENCQFLYNQCHGEMIINLNNFKENYLSTLETNGTLPINDSEYEKCGHLNKTHKNGYIEYCNLHKYLHPHPQMPVTRKFGPEVDHEFVIKDENQIVREKYNYSIYVIYQNYLNKLYNLVKVLFNYQINQLCDMRTIKVDEKIPDLLEQMKQNKNLFKSKMLYEHINIKDNTQSNEIDATQQNPTEKISFYYLKVYNYKLKINHLEEEPEDEISG